MKYKTYAKKQTKYFKRYYNKIKAIFLICLFLVIGIDITITINNNNKVEHLEKRIEIVEKVDLKMVNLISNNYQKEIEVRQAITQACLYIGADTRGVMEQCEKDLLGIAYTETKEDPFNCSLVGDLNFKGSYGCFQINKHYHPHITQEQAEDPYFASIWTAKRMVNNGYFTNRDVAVMKHNGTPYITATMNYLNKVNQIAK